MVALLLASPLALGVTARCAPQPKHSCCAGAARCCCGDAGACGCRGGSEKLPTGPQPATPQRQGDDQSSAPALAALAVSQLAAPAPYGGAALDEEADRPALTPVLENVVLRC